MATRADIARPCILCVRTVTGLVVLLAGRVLDAATVGGREALCFRAPPFAIPLFRDLVLGIIATHVPAARLYAFPSSDGLVVGADSPARVDVFRFAVS